MADVRQGSGGCSWPGHMAAGHAACGLSRTLAASTYEHAPEFASFAKALEPVTQESSSELQTVGMERCVNRPEHKVHSRNALAKEFQRARSS